MQLNNFQFMNAVDIRDLYLSPNLNEYRSTLGCLMSHYLVFKHCIENQLNEIMVLEDDFCHDGQYRQNINQYISEIPENYDLVLFGNLAQSLQSISANLLKINGPFWRTHAYIINQKLMTSYVDFIENEIIYRKLIHADCLLSHLCIKEELNVFNSSSILIKQMPFASMNQHDYLDTPIREEIKQKILNFIKNHKLF